MTEKKFSRRTFLKGASIAAGGALLAACAPSAPAQPGEPAAKATDTPAAAANNPPEPTATVALTVDPSAVTWWYSWGNLDAGIEAFTKTDIFKSAMGSTKFQFKGSVPSEAILTAVAAGTPPDGGSNFDYPNLFYKGAVVPVNNYVDVSKKIVKDDCLDKLWESSFYDGKMIGVPGLEGFMWWGLNVNIDTAQKAGLDPAALPTTWEEALDWHKKETKFDSAGNLQQFGLDPWDAMASETDFNMMSFGGMNWWDEKTRKMDLNNDVMIKSLDMMSQFIKIVARINSPGCASRRVWAAGAAPITPRCRT